jgi:hypothetical protein
VITGFNTDIEFQGKIYHVQTEDKGPAKPLLVTLVYDGGTILASKRTAYEAGVNEEELAERLRKQHGAICAAIKTGRLDDLKRMSGGTKEGGIAVKSVSNTLGKVETAASVETLEAVFQPDDFPVLESFTPDTGKILDLSTDEPVAGESAPIYVPPEAVEVVSELVGRERKAHNRLTVEILGESTFKGGEQRTVIFLVCRGSERKVVPDAQIMVKILGSAFRPVIFHSRTDHNGIARVDLQFPVFREGRAALLARAMNAGEEVELRRVVHHC